METLLELAKYTIPALIVGLITFFLVRSFMREAESQRRSEQLLKNHEITIPLRLQAYERIMLFLERISVDSLLMRHSQSGLNSRQMHTEMLTAIRSEYEHNLSQQVYITPKAWEMVKNARAQIIKVINTSAEQTNPAAPAIELSKKILEEMGEYPKSPTQMAIDYIKDEIRTLF